MEKFIIDRWESNKAKLEAYFRSTPMEEYDEYEKIVAKIIEIVLNTEVDGREKFSTDFTKIDNGNCQSVELFVLHMNSFDQNMDDYFITHNYYGSCSGCDVLMDIMEHDTEDGLPDDEQVRELMMIALHLVQRMKQLDEIDCYDEPGSLMEMYWKDGNVFKMSDGECRMVWGNKAISNKGFIPKHLFSEQLVNTNSTVGECVIEVYSPNKEADYFEKLTECRDERLLWRKCDNIFTKEELKRRLGIPDGEDLMIVG